MDLTTLFSTQPGVYVVQAFLHSLMAAIIVDRSILAWDIRNPVVRQKFHLVAVFLPVFSYPVYQMIDADRGSVQFRLATLFDSSRWLSIEVWNVLPVGLLLLLVLVLTTAVFVFQELVPIVRNRPGPVDPDSGFTRVAAGSPVALAAEGLADDPPAMFIVDDDDPSIHSVTGRAPAIYLTTGLVRDLDRAELRVALAHELAHIRRSRRPLLIFAYVARVALFFSAGSLVAFRRAAAEEEKICDDWAARTTGRPDKLASVLEKLRVGDAGAVEGDESEAGLQSIAQVSYDLMVRDRIGRLADAPSPAPGAADWSKFAITAASIAVINFFIV
jgi:Zn-dependent protease with chaperone function